MTHRAIQFTALFLIMAVATIVTSKLYHINRVKFDIDTLGVRLAPAKKILSGKTAVGFSTSMSSLWIEASYIMAPVMLVSSLKQDTLLVVQSLGSNAPYFKNYKIILKDLNGEPGIYLLTKTARQ